MHMKLHIHLVVALACASATSAFGQIAVSSTLNVGVFADANQSDVGSHQSYVMKSQFGTINSYSESVMVEDHDLINPGATVIVKSSASAAWTDAGHGTVTWRDMGWIHNTQTHSGAKLNGFVINGDVWSYTFTATENGYFNLNYDVRGRGNQFGLLGVKINWSGPGGGVNLADPYTPNAVGSFTRSVVSGQNYTIGLFNMGNKFTAPIPMQDSGFMDADFTWSVGAVPEPTSMAVFAFGLVALLRRKR